MAERATQRSRISTEQARSLAARLPELLVAARRVAANVMLGLHGRRTSGPGETFWQFRPYLAGEPARRIDWRRSARDHHLYIREREWEASQTVWLWTDLSGSMDFRSQLSSTTKLDRAITLMLALADLLARGGERVGIPGILEPKLGRDAAERLAGALAQPAAAAGWPTLDRVGRFSEMVMIGDFLDEPETIRNTLRSIAGRGAKLHLLQVFDPAEETFPYQGRLEFRDPESGGTWLTERAGSLRQAYAGRLEAHREAIRAQARQAGFTFGIHHTDRPAAEGLLLLHGRLSGNAAFAATPVRDRPAA